MLNNQNINYSKGGGEIIGNNSIKGNFSSIIRILRDLKEISIARTLMNQLLEKIDFKGKIVDIGGGNKATYRNLIKNEYFSVNIDEKMEPNVCSKVDESIPLDDATYDTCLMFNILEHVYDWNLLLSEAHRLLKNNGYLHLIIPFSYPIHACPDDFIRVTDSYLKRKLKDFNFKNINIYAIAYGPFSTSQLFMMRHRYLQNYIGQFFVLMDFILKKVIPKKIAAYTKKSPLFYYVECQANKAE
tara:strand:+ start:300 stop:1028 length:729 start_codon:yes stop_codon:yes gene_type:complete